jgi:rhodanese-related sulfurtransferase
MATEQDLERTSAIRKEELLEAIHMQRVQLVNVLERPAAGKPRLIEGSRHIPLSELESRLGELDRGKDVVVYCASYTCRLSHEAARLLADRGFHVRTYDGGIKEWVEAGLPTDGAKPQGAAGPDGSAGTTG